MQTLTRLATDQSGATAIEYGLIAAVIGVALVAVVPLIGRAITGTFSSLAGHISSGK